MIYSDRVSDAFSFALQLHRHQERKGSTIPYITHLMAVASIVGEFGGDEDLVIAGLLHDVVVDQGGLETLEKIRARFGYRRDSETGLARTERSLHRSP